MQGKVAAYHMHAKHDSKVITTHARKAFMGRFHTLVDPENQLSDAERNRRADAAKSAYFTALALKSSLARSRGRTDPREGPCSS
jgi:hypothetical protein